MKDAWQMCLSSAKQNARLTESSSIGKAHVQHVLKQLGEQDSRELIRLLGRITEIEADI